MTPDKAETHTLNPINELGEFFLRIFGALTHLYQTGESRFIAYKRFSVSASICDHIFQILWAFWGIKENCELQIVLDKNGEETEQSYVVDIHGGRMTRIRELHGREVLSIRLHIKTNLIASLWDNSGVKFLWALLKEEVMYWEKYDEISPIIPCLKKTEISPDSLEKLIGWFIPDKGLGISMSYMEKILPLILKWEDGLNLNILEPKVDKLTQSIESLCHRHNLLAGIGVNIASLIKLLRGEGTLSEFLQNYGESLSITTDFISSHKLFKVFFHSSSEHPLARNGLWDLLDFYVRNAINYIQTRPLYLVFSDGQAKVSLKIDGKGIAEEKQETPLSETFQFDIKTIKSKIDRVKNACSRAVIPILNKIIVSVSEEVYREEAVGYLVLEDPVGRRLKFFFSGGEHDLPFSKWRGDSSFLLLHPHPSNTVDSFSIPDSPLIVNNYQNRTEVDLDYGGVLTGPSLIFMPVNHETIFHGINNLVDKDSSLANTLPGYQTDITLYSLISLDKIGFARREYKVIEGMMVTSQSHGRILKGHIQYLYHLWITGESAGIISAGYHDIRRYAPGWWKHFIEVTDNHALIISKDKHKLYSSEECHFPYPKDPFTFDIKDGRLLIKDISNEASFSFTPTEAWAIPNPRDATTLIRIRALVQIGREEGFALLEFPTFLFCYSGITVPLKWQSHEEYILFTHQEVPVLRIMRGKDSSFPHLRSPRLVNILRGFFSKG